MPPKKRLRSSKESIPRTSFLPPPPIGNYRIYILNFYAPQLRQIEKEFNKQLDVQSRSHVGGVNVGNIVAKHETVDDIRITITTNLHMLNEENYKKILLETAKCIHKTKHYIDELLILEYKRFSFDLLDFWKNREPPRPKITNKGGTTARKIIKAKCTLETPRKVDLLSKDSSKVRKVMFDQKKHFKVDHPQDGSDIFILLVGNFNNKFVLDLLEAQYPIGGMTFFIPVTLKYKFMAGFIPQMKDFYSLMIAEETKNVSFDVEFLPILSPCQAEYFGKQIDDELTCHVYDLEIIRVRNYRDFLSRYIQNDVSLKGECLRMNTDPAHHHTFCDLKEVLNFYEDMLANIDPTPSSEFLQDNSSYFIDNEFDCIIFEENNMLLKEEMKLNSLSKSFTRIYKFLRNKVIKILEDFDHSDTHIHFQDTDETRVYLEPFTNLTLCQRFLELYDDSKSCSKYQYDDWTLVVFEKSTFFKQNIAKQNLMTKVCFRDFMHYIFPKQPILGRLELEKITKEIDSGSKFPNNVFIRSRSFKMIQNYGSLNRKFTTLHYEKNTMSDNSCNTMPQPIFGYNLGDTYVELTTDERVFR